MKNFKFGDIVLTEFPYFKGAEGKKRPALVLIDANDDDLIISVITSKSRSSKFDVALKEWKKSNLLFPSTVRVHKIMTKEKSTIIGKLGEISTNDLKVVIIKLKELWSKIIF